MGKRIAFIGAGAVGSYVGGHMARIGANVTLIDPWPAHVDSMREHGLRLSGVTDEENVTVKVRAMHLTEVQQFPREGLIDIAFNCMKSYDTEWATMMIKDYLAPGGYVVSLQNCINEERIAGIVGWGRTVGCIASRISVELTGPGTVRRGAARGGNQHTVFRVGEVHGRVTPRVEELAGLLASSDSTKVTTNLWGERWSKLCTNAMANGLSACTGMSGNEMTRNESTRRFAIRVCSEAVRVGVAMGFDLEEIHHMPAETWERAGRGDAAALATVEETMLASTKSKAEGQRPSMGQDMVKGRRTEIDYINGHISAKGKEAGIPTPANDALTDIVHRVERGEMPPSPDHIVNLKLG